jgi:hypothetical protein
MYKFRYFQRRVFFDREQSTLIVRIEPHSDRLLYVPMLIVFTGFFIFICMICVRALVREFSAETALALSPVMAFISVWYIMGLRLTVWRAFGTEQIVIDGGVFHWDRTALCWKRNLELPTAEITDVKAIMPWHGLSNCVEFRTRSKKWLVGDMLLRDEAVELAKRLRETVRH